jgi:hypothetical protein
MAVKVGIKDIDVDVKNMTAVVDVAGHDKLIYIANGSIKEIELPHYGEVIVQIVNGQIMKFDHKVGTKVR